MGTVFYPVGQKLVALERLNGTVEWTQDLGASPTTPAGVGDGAVFVGLDDKTLVAMDLEEGFVRFVRSLDGTVTAGPTVVGNMVLVGTDTGTGGGTLFALNTFNGTELWSRDMSAPVMAQPAVWEGMVFALSDNGAIMSLNMTDGALNWQYPVGKSPGSSLTASPAISGERLFVASTSGYVYCLDADPSDGLDEGKEDPVDSEYDVIWTYKEEDQTPFNASPVLVSGNAVLLSGESGVLALNATNGTIAWREDLANTGPLTMDAIAVNGSVVVGGNGVFILDATTGAMTCVRLRQGGEPAPCGEDLRARARREVQDKRDHRVRRLREHRRQGAPGHLVQMGLRRREQHPGHDHIPSIRPGGHLHGEAHRHGCRRGE
jgi:outer membrane protein assembly factor BamB